MHGMPWLEPLLCSAPTWGGVLFAERLNKKLLFKKNKITNKAKAFRCGSAGRAARVCGEKHRACSPGATCPPATPPITPAFPAMLRQVSPCESLRRSPVRSPGMQASDRCVDTYWLYISIYVCMYVYIYIYIHIGIPFGDHPLELERYREHQCGPCARMTRTSREV